MNFERSSQTLFEKPSIGRKARINKLVNSGAKTCIKASQHANFQLLNITQEIEYANMRDTQKDYRYPLAQQPHFGGSRH
jgi:hypothetical protein